MEKTDYSHLSPEATAFVEWGLSEFELDTEKHKRKLLIQAGETLDRIDHARKVIEREGAFWTDTEGRPRKHPALDCERNDRIVFARLLRELNLDVEPPPESRPPGLRY